MAARRVAGFYGGGDAFVVGEVDVARGVGAAVAGEAAGGEDGLGAGKGGGGGVGGGVAAFAADCGDEEAGGDHRKRLHARYDTPFPILK